MESLTKSLNYELPQELHFDKYAQQILENSRTPNLADTTTIALASSPGISTFDSTASLGHQTTTSEFLKKLGATFIHSIQLQSLPRANNLDTSSSAAATAAAAVLPAASSFENMELEFSPHHLVMNSHSYNNNNMDDIQKQLDYDKFMNEVWIGVVLTLILISMIFCFCSCFLYHQFRVWKRNYHTTVTQTGDVDAVKLDLDVEDPVPEYTLVSGLPTYEAALELLQKNPQSCLLVPPSVFEVFNKNEKSSNEVESLACAQELSVPLLSDTSNKAGLPCYNETTTPITTTTTTTASLPYNHSLASLLSLATQITTQCKPKSATATATATVSEEEKQFKA